MDNVKKYDVAMKIFRQAFEAEEHGRVSEAAQCYGDAARMNLVSAQINLGNIYFSDKEFRDFHKARYWYKRAANLGSSDAASNLVVLYNQLGNKRWKKYWTQRTKVLKISERRGKVYSKRLMPPS